MKKYRPADDDGEVTTVKNTICVFLQEDVSIVRNPAFKSLFDLYVCLAYRVQAAERILNKVFKDDGTFKLDNTGRIMAIPGEIRSDLDRLKRTKEPFNLTKEDEKEIQEFRKEMRKMRRNQENSEGGD